MEKNTAPETQVRGDFVEAAYDLSTWAACISWNGGKNQKEWLDELREKIETVQRMAKELRSEAPVKSSEGPAE